MAFQLSPGVNVSEIDATTVVPAVATSVGGFAGEFTWGPVNEVTIVSSENQLAEKFGKPTSDNFESFYTAANFLAYASDLRVVRAVGTGANNASANSSAATLIENRNDYDQNHGSNTAATYVDSLFFAKYPGTLGNSLKVSMADSNTFTGWAYSSYFDSVPATSSWVSTRSGSNDEMHIIVIDEDGKISGTAGTILEKYGFASKASDARNADGTSNYYKDVLNNKSKYIWWGGHAGGNWGNTSTSTTFSTLSANVTHSLVGGTDEAPGDSDITGGFDLFANSESIDVNILMAGAASTSTVPNHIIALAETRKDCMVCVSPYSAEVVDNAGSEATSISNGSSNDYTKSSYAIMDSGWKYQYDKYNDVYRWIPLNGDVGGLLARTDQQRDPWFSPAGFSRGVIKNVVKLSWNPSQAERDTLFKNGVNPVVSFVGEGTVLFGDKTLQNRPSAFDRVNVRRLFITLEKAIARAARSSLFEFNDEFTRAQFVNLVEPFLRDVQGRRGIYDFRVVCDTTNNTAEVIDSNQFVGDIYIKPSRSINFIQLNFVAVRSGVAFDEIVGKF